MVRPEDEIIRKRQRERSRIMALLLAAFVVLMFVITIAKTGMNW
jgi:predicted nucleic acid-binding Zn ribbon protein